MLKCSLQEHLEVNQMILNQTKLEVALARVEMPLSGLRKWVSPQTIRKVRRGESIQPRTVGRIAKALGVDPADLIKED